MSAPLPSVQSTLLANGLEVVAVEMPHLHYADVSAWLRCGARFESEAQNGVSHFVEHMVFRGTRSHPDLHALTCSFEELGTELDAETGVESGRYRMLVSPDRLEPALDLLGEVLFAPRFPDSAMDAERRVLEEEALADFNDLGNLIDPAELMCRLLYPGTGLDLSTAGKVDVLGRLERDELLDHHRRFYDPRNIVIIVSGAVSAERVMTAARAAYEGVAATGEAVAARTAERPIDEAQDAPRVSFTENPDNQTQLMLSFRSVGYDDPAYLTGCVLAQILGGGYTSRINYEIREKAGLAYDIGAYLSSVHDVGSIDIAVTTRSEQTHEVLRRVVDELLRLRQGPIDEAEVERVRRRWLLNLHTELDSPAAASERYGWARLFSRPEPPANEEARIRALGADDIAEAAAATIRPERAGLVAVGPAGSLDEDRALAELERLATA